MTISCPVCSADSREENRFDDIHLHRCDDCGHCFTDQHALVHRETYDETYFDDTHEKWNANPDTVLFSHVERLISSFKKNATVLDVGCGTGMILRYLRETNPELVLTGIDLSAPAQAEGIEYIRGDILRIEHLGQYDVVINSNVIEHVEDVQVFASRLKKFTKPAGLLIITTINDRGLLYRAAHVLRSFGYRVPFERIYSRHHLHHFTYASLRRLMEIHGLSVVELRRHHMPLAACDLPRVSPPVKAVLMAGIWVLFRAGELVGMTSMQTIACHND